MKDRIIGERERVREGGAQWGKEGEGRHGGREGIVPAI